jgi:glutamate-ammonia-ligase adenylyltransferase
VPPLSCEFGEALDRLRRWHREAHFRIGVHLLRDLAGPEEAGRAYADLADAALRAALGAAEAETVRRYGRVPGMRVGVFGMGSLGARRLTARSDLDLVVVHDGRGQSDGRRPLAAGQWAAKLTQSLVTALTAPTGAGRLYEVDMRLRPSGRQGPVAVTLEGFEAYQATEAWVWEHLALSRARPIAGPRRLRAEMERARRAALRGTRFGRAGILRDLGDMLGRLRDAKPGGGLDPKDGPGRLTEIELAAQAQALLAGSAARDTAAQLAVGGWLTPVETTTLREGWTLMSTARQVLRLLSDRSDAAALGTGGAALLAARTGHADLDRLQAAMDRAAERAQEAIEGGLARG